MEKSKSSESFKLNFFGLKYECINPGSKTIILLLMVLCFLTVIIILFKEVALPAFLYGTKKTSSLLLKGNL